MHGMSASKNPGVEALSEETSNPNAIGAGIKRYRQKRKWPLKTLSERSGVPVSTLSKVENGQMSLKLEKLLRVSNALEIDIMQLVSPAEPEAPVSDAAQLEQMFAGMAAMGPEFTYPAGHEVIVSGDIAVHIAPWTMTAQSPDGQTVEQSGLSVAVLRKQPDGGWKMVIDNPHGGRLLEQDH